MKELLFSFPEGGEDNQDALEELAGYFNHPAYVLLAASLSEPVVYAHSYLLILEVCFYDPERSLSDEECQLIDFNFETEEWLIAVLKKERLEFARRLAQKHYLEFDDGPESAPLPADNLFVLRADIEHPLYSEDEEILGRAIKVGISSNF